MVMKLMRCCIKPEAQLFESPFLLLLCMQDSVFQDGIELSEMLVVQLLGPLDSDERDHVLLTLY